MDSPGPTPAQLHAAGLLRRAVDLHTAVERGDPDADPAAAAAAYQAVLDDGLPELVPQSAYNLGRLRERLGDTTGAERALRRAVATGDRYFGSLAAAALGALLVLRRDQAGALRAFEQVVALADDRLLEVLGFPTWSPGPASSWPSCGRAPAPDRPSSAI
jgi:tetratricopeptide (TPR) repeat protein